MSKLAAWLSLAVLLVGCQTSATRPLSGSIARFFLEDAAGHGALVTLPRSEVQIALGAKPVFTEFDIVDVDLVEVKMGKCLRFEFTPAAARDLYRLSASNQGQRLVLMIDHKPLGARRIDRPLNDGTVLIFLELSDDALPATAENLRQSALALQQAAANR